MDVPDRTQPGLDFDVRSMLHEEIDRLPNRQRLPVVLCDLEGLTYEQAAGRLQWTAPTLYHRLAKGRKRLRDRLIRRGITATAVGAALELSDASAAVPAAWARAAVAAATGGPLPTVVAALAHTLIRSLLMTRLKIALVTFLAMTALASASVVAAGAGRLHAPSSASPEPPATKAPPSQANEPKAAAKRFDREVRDFKNEAPKRGALRIAKLMHAGDWNIAPQAIPNLMDALRKPPFSIDVVMTQKDLFPRDPNLIYYPLIYIHGRGALSFPKEDLDALRRHLDPGGGTLFADAACGSPAFDAAFRRFAAELLPEHRLEPIPRDDELYSDKAGYDLRECQYSKAAGGGKDYPQLEGVKLNGHWAIIYSKFDLGCALERHSGIDCKGYTFDSAVRIAGNIVNYSTFP